MTFSLSLLCMRRGEADYSSPRVMAKLEAVQRPFGAIEHLFLNDDPVTVGDTGYRPVKLERGTVANLIPRVRRIRVSRSNEIKHIVTLDWRMPVQFHQLLFVGENVYVIANVPIR